MQKKMLLNDIAYMLNGIVEAIECNMKDISVEQLNDMFQLADDCEQQFADIAFPND